MTGDAGPPAGTRRVLAALTDGPAKVLLLGGIGTGKSTACEAVRRRLREGGGTVLARAPRPGEAADAVVVDDAHLLDAADLRRLAEIAEDPAAVLVVAAEPREQDPDLRALTTALERQSPRITLGPLDTGEIGMPLDPADVRAATAGIPLLVAAAAADPDEPARAAFFALSERLRRLDPDSVEALLVLTLGPELGAADLAPALGLPAPAGHRLADQARATGLADPAHSPQFRSSVHQAAAQIVGAARHHEIESALLRTQLESSTLSADVAVQLAEHGLRDPALAAPLRRAAAGHPNDPNRRARILRAALDAGDAGAVPALADALALAGRCRPAAELADTLLGAADPGDRAAGVRVAAALAANDGNGAQAAELFDWLGPYPDAAVTAAAVMAQIGAGRPDAARAALAAEHAGPPTAAARAARGLAEGLLMTVDRPYPAAAVRLGQAAAGERAAVVLPDSPAALVTLAALHSGDVAGARSAMARAIAEGADPLFAARHRLLAGWARMQDGQLAAAAEHAGAAAAAGEPGAAPHRRDALWLAALRTALARRGGDAGALQQHWQEAMETLSGYAIDVYTLLPLGELWMAAARLRQPERLSPFLEQAFGVLAGLGDPPAWSLPLRWAGVHAGILTGDPAAVAPHGQALAAAAARSPFAAALAAAGRAWLRVLATEVDPDEVIAAARDLARFGLTSDATRLAGQAALSATDSKVSALMLQVARELRVAEPETPAGPRPGSAGTGGAHSRGLPSAALSEREREVARLLLLGMPYRDIGAQLFISAKTVEHHVARIRRRIGAQSRSELLSMLRAALGPEAIAAP